MYQGDFDTTETVNLPFNTFSSNDPSASVTITNLAAGDIEIHKDGGVTQRTSDVGVTVSIDFDGITGNHMIHIDLSDDTHAGFYSAGSRYQVRIEGATVDAGTINAWIGTFSIGTLLRPTTAGRTLDVNATGEAGLDLDNTSGTLAAAQFAADFITAAKIADNAFLAVNFASDFLTAAKIAAGAIDNATFAADVGSTAYATNIIALAVRKALDEIKLDHLVAVADADDPVDNSIIAKLATKAATANWSDFANTTDSLQAIRDDRTLAAADYVVVTDTIARVTLVDTTTTNTDMAGTDNAGTAVELAKVPKSDSNVTFNATALASINAEVDTALSDAGVPEGIPKNAIFNNIEFLMVDATDFATPETGLTVTGTRSIDGGAFAGVSGAIAEVANGIYQFDAAAADLNGDVITFKFSSAGAADTFLTIKTSS